MNAKNCATIMRSHAPYIQSGALSLSQAKITVENIKALISELFSDDELDLRSIYIDFNDYWGWHAIIMNNLRVVMIRYNAVWLQSAALTVPCDPERGRGVTSYFGASLSVPSRLTNKKGHALVAFSLSGMNVFFVHKDILVDKFYVPDSMAEHCKPERCYPCGLHAADLHAMGAPHRLGSVSPAVRGGNPVPIQGLWGSL